MRSSPQMDEIELRTSILPTCDYFLLKTWWYFEDELPGGYVMSKYWLINDEQYYWEIQIGEEDVSITNDY